MSYRLAADLTLLLHLAFILFALFGGLLALRWRWMAGLHLPALVWGALVEFNGWFCPLTFLENRLRRLTGEAGFAGGFVEYYLVPLIYPPGLDRDIQWLLGAVLVAWNLAVYGGVAAVWLRRRAAK